MKYFVLIFILLSNSLFSLEWYDLELNQSLVLDKEIYFEPENITLSKGNIFVLNNILELPINVTIFSFDVLNCPGQNFSTEMIIVDPSSSLLNSSVGVQLQKNCQLEVFVEFKDYFSKSLFTLN